MGQCSSVAERTTDNCEVSGSIPLIATLFTYLLTPMFLSCPVSFDLMDAEWYQDVDDAKEDALDWSVALSGEKVIVYQALEGEDGDYEFKKLYSVFA